MVSSALPAKQLAECRVITHHVQMAKATRAAPYPRKQAQYELERFVPPVGTLNRYAALVKTLREMAFLEHFEEQGKAAKWGYLLVYKLYVTISHQII